MLRLAVGQMEPTINDLEGNLAEMQAILDSGRDQSVDVLVLTGRINSGYAFKNWEEVQTLTEEIPNGPFSKELASWSKKGGLVAAGLCEKTAEGYYDSAALFSGGNHVGTYRKIHLYDNDVDWFLPGQKQPPILEYRGYRFGVTLGYDWAFPELTRTLVLRGTQVLLHMTNLLLNYTPRAMISRSIENRIFVAVASRIGEERGYKFIGGSQVTDPRGHVLLQTDKSEKGLFWVDIDPAVADNKAISKRSDLLKDRRPQFYGHLADD
ncbi:MAG: nitrilase-related carbon-nitrogen hydrolase, partial [Candidatus Thorarchaeota archaeon]